jgi:sentrin-specific protease 1
MISTVYTHLRTQLPAQLPSEAQEEVNRILNNPRFTSKAGREQVHRADILRLQPGAWLNDEVINFYGQLIVDRAAAHEGGKENIENRKQSTTSKLRQRRPLKVHYFNTYFWPKVQIGYKQSNLKKWTKKV